MKAMANASLVALVLTLGYLAAAVIGIVLLLANAIVTLWFTIVMAYTGS